MSVKIKVDEQVKFGLNESDFTNDNILNSDNSINHQVASELFQHLSNQLQEDIQYSNFYISYVPKQTEEEYITKDELLNVINNTLTDAQNEIQLEYSNFRRNEYKVVDEDVLKQYIEVNIINNRPYIGDEWISYKCGYFARDLYASIIAWDSRLAFGDISGNGHGYNGFITKDINNNLTFKLLEPQSDNIFTTTSYYAQSYVPVHIIEF